MLPRLFGVLMLLVVLTLGALAGPAAAVEDEGGEDTHAELPGIDEVGSQSDIAREFFPEPAEEHPFTEALVYPLLALAIIVVLVFLFLYLKWQPTFDAEEESRRR